MTDEGKPVIHVSATEPERPLRGEVWVDGTRGEMFIRGADGSWVSVGASGLGVQMDEVRESVKRFTTSMRVMGRAVIRSALLPHRVEKDEEGFWVCSRCGARAWEPEMIQGVECVE